MLVPLIFAMVLAVAGAAAIAYGSYRWKAGTRRLHAALAAASIPITPGRIDFLALQGLPAPVQRYLRLVLVDGAPIVAAAQVHHTGSMKMSVKTTHWKPFTSNQQVVTRRPGFDWDARISMLPGLPVLVHDAYVAGEGRLHAALFGLVTVARLSDTAEMAKGELMRFLAEAVWYPTALLPGQGVSWEALDGRCARATLTDGAVTVSLDFSFDEQGLVDAIRAHARGRSTGGRIVPTAWSGRFWHYQEVGGMLVPLNGEVAWCLADGIAPYWRGEIAAIVHSFAD